MSNIDHARLKAGTVCRAGNYGIVSSAWAHASQLSASASPYAGAVFPLKLFESAGSVVAANV